MYFIISFIIIVLVSACWADDTSADEDYYVKPPPDHNKNRQTHHEQHPITTPEPIHHDNNEDVSRQPRNNKPRQHLTTNPETIYHEQPQHTQHHETVSTTVFNTVAAGTSNYPGQSKISQTNNNTALATQRLSSTTTSGPSGTIKRSNDTTPVRPTVAPLPTKSSWAVPLVVGHQQQQQQPQYQQQQIPSSSHANPNQSHAQTPGPINKFLWVSNIPNPTTIVQHLIDEYDIAASTILSVEAKKDQSLMDKFGFMEQDLCFIITLSNFDTLRHLFVTFLYRTEIQQTPIFSMYVENRSLEKRLYQHWEDFQQTMMSNDGESITYQSISDCEEGNLDHDDHSSNNNEAHHSQQQQQQPLVISSETHPIVAPSSSSSSRPSTVAATATTHTKSPSKHTQQQQQQQPQHNRRQSTNTKQQQNNTNRTDASTSHHVGNSTPVKTNKNSHNQPKTPQPATPALSSTTTTQTPSVHPPHSSVVTPNASIPRRVISSTVSLPHESKSTTTVTVTPTVATLSTHRDVVVGTTKQGSHVRQSLPPSKSNTSATEQVVTTHNVVITDAIGHEDDTDDNNASIAKPETPVVRSISKKPQFISSASRTALHTHTPSNSSHFVHHDSKTTQVSSQRLSPNVRPANHATKIVPNTDHLVTAAIATLDEDMMMLDAMDTTPSVIVPQNAHSTPNKRTFQNKTSFPHAKGQPTSHHNKPSNHHGSTTPSTTPTKPASSKIIRHRDHDQPPPTLPSSREQPPLHESTVISTTPVVSSSVVIVPSRITIKPTVIAPPTDSASSIVTSVVATEAPRSAIIVSSPISIIPHPKPNKIVLPSSGQQQPQSNNNEQSSQITTTTVVPIKNNRPTTKVVISPSTPTTIRIAAPRQPSETTSSTPVPSSRNRGQRRTSAAPATQSNENESTSAHAASESAAAKVVPGTPHRADPSDHHVVTGGDSSTIRSTPLKQRQKQQQQQANVEQATGHYDHAVQIKSSHATAEHIGTGNDSNRRNNNTPVRSTTTKITPKRNHHYNGGFHKDDGNDGGPTVRRNIADLKPSFMLDE